MSSETEPNINNVREKEGNTQQDVVEVEPAHAQFLSQNDKYSEENVIDINSIENKDHQNKSSQSRATQYRLLQKVKINLPDTPQSKSMIIERLIESPSCRKVLEKKGVVQTKEAQANHELGQEIVNTVKDVVSKLKTKGTLRRKEAVTYKTLLRFFLE